LSEILQQRKGETKSMNDIKQDLLSAFRPYFPKYETQIINILLDEGKHTWCEKIKKKTITFDDYVQSEHYYLTPLDYWLLAEKYEIPLFLISSFTLSMNKKHEKLVFGRRDDDFAFIVVPALKVDNLPIYKYIVDPQNQNQGFFPLSSLPSCNFNKDLLACFDEVTENVQHFIETYKKSKNYLRKPNFQVVESPKAQTREKKSPKTAKRKPKLILV
jgi:hypothetical protein